MNSLIVQLNSNCNHKCPGCYVTQSVDSDINPWSDNELINLLEEMFLYDGKYFAKQIIISEGNIQSSRLFEYKLAERFKNYKKQDLNASLIIAMHNSPKNKLPLMKYASGITYSYEPKASYLVDDNATYTLNILLPEDKDMEEFIYNLGDDLIQNKLKNIKRIYLINRKTVTKKINFQLRYMDGFELVRKTLDFYKWKGLLLKDSCMRVNSNVLSCQEDNYPNLVLWQSNRTYSKCRYAPMLNPGFCRPEDALSYVFTKLGICLLGTTC